MTFIVAYLCGMVLWDCVIMSFTNTESAMKDAIISSIHGILWPISLVVHIVIACKKHVF